MIADRLENIKLYSGLSADIRLGLEYLAQLDANVELNSFFLNERVRVIITAYETDGPPFEGYESHRKFVDIQYPITGREKVLWSPLKGMKILEEYVPEIDRAVWNHPGQHTEVVTGEGIFAIFFPEDAHRPCLPVGGNVETIKKVTLKVEIN